MTESALATAISQAIEAKAAMAESNSGLDVKCNFCKEKLIPKAARLLRKMAEELSPIPTHIHRALSYDMLTVCGERDAARLMGLGGITMGFPLKDNVATASWFLFADLARSEVGVLVALTPEVEFAVYGDNVFELAQTLNGAVKMPTFSLSSLDGSKEVAEPALRPGSKFGTKSISFCSIKADYYKIADTEYYKFIKSMWKYSKDTLALIAGPERGL